MFVQFVREGRWSTVFGYLLFIAMMATGYFYNVTFIQLGLTDLCRRILGMQEEQTALNMALLALLSLITALAFGYWMMKSGNSANFRLKLRVTFVVVIAQTLLTLLATEITSHQALFAWILFASLALGVGMPATFSLTVDLIPRPDRGMVAGVITAGTYFASNAFSSATWHMEHFRYLSLLVMIPGVLGMAVLVLAPRAVPTVRLLDTLSGQHQQPVFGVGRLLIPGSNGTYHLRRSLVGLLAMMFGVYFIDSLGFLRLLETPLYMRFAWQSVELDIHLFIAITHVVAALAGGILYASLTERQLFLWVFGFFALAQLMYTFHTRFGSADYAPLTMPMLYAISVSLYTVVNFAIWADVATPQTISFYAALGVAFSGWAATFLSTALAIYLHSAGVSFSRHFEVVNAISCCYFLVLLQLPVVKGLIPSSAAPEVSP